jgi:hypothetical protein
MPRVGCQNSDRHRGMPRLADGTGVLAPHRPRADPAPFLIYMGLDADMRVAPSSPSQDRHGR